MSTSMLAVDEKTRTRLQELSKKTGKSEQEILDQAIEDYRRKVFLETVNADYAALRADPAAWGEIEEERRTMQGSLMDGLDPTERWGDDGDLMPPTEGKADG